MHGPNDILDYWFGQGPLDSARLTERTAFWFGGDGAEKTAARDADIREKLEPLLLRAARGEFDSWAATPRRRLALILLFDQVPRNIYRGTANSFAFDTKSLSLAVEGLHLAADQALDPAERMFFYLPLEHAESLEAQDAAVKAFERLADEAPAELREFFAYTLKYAHGHRDIVAKFGRFPHRNEALRRDSTPAEIEWLASGGERFGQ
ncbi:MAG: DUF924 domain-containing protein [Steroidobacteraceae bacterium]|nr:DUF924 domain-containing protein [Steroidobacteraceae bacterium]